MSINIGQVSVSNIVKTRRGGAGRPPAEVTKAVMEMPVPTDEQVANEEFPHLPIQVTGVESDEEFDVQAQKIGAQARAAKNRDPNLNITIRNDRDQRAVHIWRLANNEDNGED